MYECSIEGDGSTLWSGSAFDCVQSLDEIILHHTMFMEGTMGSCNDGNIIAHSIPANLTTYVSQLTILSFNPMLNGQTVICSHNTDEVSIVGSEVIMTSGIY